MDYTYLKDLVQEMGEMKIDIKLVAKPVKKQPFKLAQKYKYIVKREIENTLTARVIYPCEQSEWASAVVIQP